MQSLFRVFPMWVQLVVVLFVISQSVIEISAQQTQFTTPSNQLGTEKNGMCCPDPIRAAENSNGDVSLHRNIALLPSTDCGPIYTNKVAGGEKANLGEFPWMALLIYNTPWGLRFGCGASIINSRYILTAAHCVSGLRNGYSLHSVVLGEQNTETDPDCVDGVCNQERQEIFFDKVVAHEQYDKTQFAHDIALVRLSQDVSFRGDFVKPVCLPITNRLVEQRISKLVVSGWGITESQNRSSDLLAAKLSLVPISDCRTAHRQPQLDDNQLCAKGNGIVDTCRGDSGGPLVYPSFVGNSAKYVQWGVVSVGAPGCGVLAESKPGIYVRVQKYMNWILDNMEA